MKRRRFLINLLYWAAILALVYGVLNYVIGWLLPLLIGLVIARLLNPPIRFLARKTRIPRKLIAYLFAVLFFAVIGTLLFLLGTVIFRAVRDQIQRLPEYYTVTVLPALRQIEQWVMENMGDFIADWDTGGDGSNLVAMLTNTISNLPAAFGTVFGMAAQTPVFLVQMLFTFLFTLFGTVYYEDAVAFILRQMSEKRRLFLSDTIVSLKHSIVSYYGAYLKIMAVTFAELLVGLSIIQGRFSILPAFLIALVDFVPALGCGMVLVPWAVISLITGNTYMAVALFILYLIIFIIRQFIEPKIVGDQLGLNPLLMLVSMYIGFQAIGPLGVIIMPIVVTVIADLQRHEKIHVVN
jgi:sporulation integral membrane protein YtvI